MAQEKKLSKPPVPAPEPDPEMVKQMEFLKELGLMEMIVDTGLDRKMKAPETRK